MMQVDVQRSGVRVQLRFGGKERGIEIPEARVEQARQVWGVIVREPFGRRAWRELFHFAVSGALTGAAAFAMATTLGAGVVLLLTFVGVVILAGSVRGARNLGRWYRSLARALLEEDIEEPGPFRARPGFFGWLQSALRDRVGWRAIGYTVAKCPLVLVGAWFALSVWVDAFFCLGYPLWGAGAARPRLLGVVPGLLSPGYLSVGSGGFFHGLFIVLTGVLLFFLAPWPMRLVTEVDRRLLRHLLGPDPVAVRLRSLEDARTRTVDVSAATLRRIERDLHDGTQAQLVALAMRLGQAKEKLAEGTDLDQVRQLVEEAHRGAKEAIVELRDLARGIHPPVLDTGLEGALTTLAARSAVPTQLTVEVRDRPTPAIEAIAYFCVAELLANVAQHARASRAAIRCTQHGQWLRLVVRDDGRGGARPSARSSGLTGLLDRVRTVDGHLDLASPPGGPTVVTVDLPMHA